MRARATEIGQALRSGRATGKRRALENQSWGSHSSRRGPDRRSASRHLSVALTYGARGGVYIAGGIVPRILRYLANSTFRQRFEQKGRMTSILNASRRRSSFTPRQRFWV
jgi:hypothetical protein